jgi:hypothetical protein
VTSETALVLLAALAQGAIALVLLWILGTIRVPLVTRRQVRLRDVALSRDPWPENEKKISNAVDNQFQLPVLFYVAAAIAVYLGAGSLDVILAWAFVATRIAHAAVFATTNNVAHRFFTYAAGYAILVIFWIAMFVRIAMMTAGG